MGYLILEMREGSGYGDSDRKYEFPARYLRQFDEALADGEAVALIYEPRREGGRRAYVAWTRVRQRPTRPAATGDYVAQFDGGLRSFDQPVPFALNGIPVEHRLRPLSPNEYGRAVQGRAVRPIPEGNALEILALGSASYARTRVYDLANESIETRERVRKTIEQIERDARFRDRILMNYGFRCGLSGLGIGPNPASKLHGVLDAAHIRPVSQNGPDAAGNGIAMTPTLHRLFDAGLFTLVPRQGAIVVERSPQLHEQLLRSDRSRLQLENGMELLLPSDAAAAPTKEFLSFHREQVFLRSA
ncbi:MAG: HNH endonuclease [Planctomycetota bacterium]|nr:HNH endonuclease [Planctomycetota bacterium]